MHISAGVMGDTLVRRAIDASEAASVALLNRFRPPIEAPLRIDYKGPSDVVTDADMASDKAIVDVLTRSGVPGNILSEESRTDSGDSRLTWLIDPLCGTLPFSTGLPHWGVCIALSAGDELLLGVVALPTAGEVISAVKGQGAFLNGRPLRAQEPPGDLRDIGVAIEGNNQRYTESQRILQRAPGRTYAYESAAYPIGQVVLGRLHGVAGLSGVSVHTAAGVAIAREMGICVTDEVGNDVAWAPERGSNGLVIAWPRTHQALMQALSDGISSSK